MITNGNDAADCADDDNEGNDHDDDAFSCWEERCTITTPS